MRECMYKYAILKFFLPDSWRKNHFHSSACTVCNGKYSGFKHLKNLKGWKKPKLQQRNQKSRESTRETSLTEAFCDLFGGDGLTRDRNCTELTELWINCFV